jgi:pilus assembly protein CpaF
MQEIFRFERTGTDAEGNVLGRHRATGIRPKFAKRAEEFGFKMPMYLSAAE